MGNVEAKAEREESFLSVHTAATLNANNLKQFLRCLIRLRRFVAGKFCELPQNCAKRRFFGGK
jgi:hypothetical protein